MEIIMTDYPSGSPQDLKYLFFKKGYHIVQVEQLGKCKLRIIYEKEFGNGHIFVKDVDNDEK